MPRVLVTGGAGFIGSHLCEALIARGDSVVVLDDLSTSHTTNLDRLLGQPRFELVEGSILDQPLVEQVSAGCDWTAHLASAVGVRLIMEQPLRSLRTLVSGTQHVLDAAHRHHHSLFLLTSTSEIYGRNTDLLDENAARVLGPTTIGRWAYSAGKSVDEFLVLGFWRELGLPAVVVRLFNTVGPRQSGAYGMVLPRLVDQALQGHDLTVYGDGRQSRTFCHISDVIKAVLSLTGHPGAVGLPVNVGSEEEVTVLELAHRVLAATGSASGIRHLDIRERYPDGFDEVRRRHPDISRVRALTGWEPSHTLDATIRSVVADRRSRLARSSVQGEDT